MVTFVIFSAGVGVLNGQVDPLFMLTPVIVDKLHTIRERVYRDHNHREGYFDYSSILKVNLFLEIEYLILSF